MWQFLCALFIPSRVIRLQPCRHFVLYRLLTILSISNRQGQPLGLCRSHHESGYALILGHGPVAHPSSLDFAGPQHPCTSARVAPPPAPAGPRSEIVFCDSKIQLFSGESEATNGRWTIVVVPSRIPCLNRPQPDELSSGRNPWARLPYHLGQRKLWPATHYRGSATQSVADLFCSGTRSG